MRESNKTFYDIGMITNKFLFILENQNPEFGCTYLECPSCGQILGDKFGDQPETGIMSYKVIPKGLPGFEVKGGGRIRPPFYLKAISL